VSRLAEWNEPRRIKTVVTYGDSEPDIDDPIMKLLHERQEQSGWEHDDGYSTWELMRSSREVIYRRDGDEGPELTYVMHSLNIDIGELKRALAVASEFDVPVLANTSDDEADLTEAYQDLITNGFDVPTEDGKHVRFVMTNEHPGRRIDLDALTATRTLSPVQVASIGEAVRQKLAEYIIVDRLLATLRAGVSKLREELSSPKRNENRLQSILTRYPILFGLEFRRVIPKHKLGSSYEMDYALERLDGRVDLLEIESSNLALYTQSGNPRKELVHAEQQVLDWLEWIDEAGLHARMGHKGLEGLVRPVGYVIIGRSNHWNDDLQAKLRRRNQALGGSVHILTFDHLLEWAETTLTTLGAADVIGPATDDE
jgi:hypothetical protein